MATYGYDFYGESTYGPSAPTGPYPGAQATIPVINTAYVLPSFSATPLDYANIIVTWTPFPPATLNAISEFRLVASQWGFPVDQNDGTVVFDVAGSPPSIGLQWLDNTAGPGKVQYYGAYVLVSGAWLRAGFTACMLPQYNGYDIRLMSDLPAYFQNQAIGAVSVDQPLGAPSVPSSGGSVTSPYSFSVNVWLSESANVMVNGIAQGEQTFFVLPPNGTVTISYAGSLTWQWITPAGNTENTTLANFLSVVGYGLDIVKSQYDMKFRSLNAPMQMSLGDLASLCAEIGLPYNPEIPAYTMRKAALFWGQVMQERGTLDGIAEHITLLTGYASDVQVSRNMLLDDDQANPVDPAYQSWSASAKYVVGDIVMYPTAAEWSVASSYAVGAVVTYNDLMYTCVLAVTQIAPGNTTYWSQNVNGPYTYYCVSAVTTLPGTAPSGSLSANGTWTAIYGGDENGTEMVATISIAGLSGTAGTWEHMESNGTQLDAHVGIGFPTPQAWTQGASTPQTGPNGYGHTFRALNNTGGSLSNTMLRSLCRQAGFTSSNLYPDPQIVVEHAVPLPGGVEPWSSSVTYATNTVVSFAGCLYIALRQSKGAQPPTPGVILNQNYDFEVSLTPWTLGAAPTGTTATMSQSTAQAYHGTHSMLINFTGTGGAYTGSSDVAASSESIPVIPGATYKQSTLVQANTTGAGYRLAIHYSDPFGGFQGSSFSGAISLTANTWTATSGLWTAPSNAYTAQFGPEPIAPSSNTSSFNWNYYNDVTKFECIATPEWARLGHDSRFPVTMSGYAVADLGFNPTVSTTITPYVEWYDTWGNPITRVFARTTSTSGGYPSNYQFDAFNTAAGSPLAGRTPTNPASVWSVPAGSWNISSNGNVYAGSADNDSLGIVSSAAAGFVGATVTNAAQTGDDCGPVWWYENTSNFWLAGLLELYYVESGTTNTVPYTALPAVGDRLIVEFNNTTSSTTLPNATTVTGPSVIVYKNSVATANQLLVIGSGGTATQTAMSSLTTPYLPSTSATTSNAGIGSITQ